MCVRFKYNASVWGLVSEKKSDWETYESATMTPVAKLEELEFKPVNY